MKPKKTQAELDKIFPFGRKTIISSVIIEQIKQLGLPKSDCNVIDSFYDDDENEGRNYADKCLRGCGLKCLLGKEYKKIPRQKREAIFITLFGAEDKLIGIAHKKENGKWWCRFYTKYGIRSYDFDYQTQIITKAKERLPKFSIRKFYSCTKSEHGKR